jgi:hypothetical protein
MTNLLFQQNIGHVGVSLNSLLLNNFKQPIMKALFYISLAVFLVLTGCSPQIRTYADFDPDYDLSNYRTFDWGQKVNIEADGNPLHYNELNDKRIKDAVTLELTGRGYVFSEDHPDLVLHYHIIVDDQSIVTMEPYGYRYGPYWMRMETNIYSYREGTLILDLMDAGTNNLIWRGWAVSAIDREYTPEQVDRLIKKAVARIFKNFPALPAKTSISKEIVSKNE